MKFSEHVCLLASYNQWMNARVYAAAGTLSAAELAAERRAFFGSILGTLNHLLVADTIWLKRFARHPAGHAALEPVRRLPDPAALDQMLFSDLETMAKQRRILDDIIVRWADSLTDDDLEHALHYANTRGVESDKRFFSLVMHFFNHQTHHRGQASTLLSQAGVDIGVTDLLARIPNEVVA
ncbi:MAG: DinB family protein [Burkholderiaceae bacterium]|nr:DinB family protein [Sulfuritalea sp.]MCF8173625.1 DinB family protein [Burkholderiaceae bacterium]MCF8184162.1 DinB family protein [Polynucleobacter sp.]